MGIQEAGAGELYIDGDWTVFSMMWMSVVHENKLAKRHNNKSRWQDLLDGSSAFLA